MIGSDWLRYQLQLREKDFVRAKSSKERLIYTVDSNVLFFFADYRFDKALDFSTLCRASFISKRLQNGIQQGLVPLNEYLGIYIFWKLTDSPLLIFPGPRKEIISTSKYWQQNYAQGNLNNILDNLRKKIQTGLKKQAEELDKQKDSEDAGSEVENLVDWLHNAKLCMEQAMHRSEFEKLERLRRIFEQKRILNAIGSEIRFNNENNYIIKKPSLDDPDRCFDPKQVKKFRDRLRFWFDELASEKSSKTPDINLSDDAEMLALLEWINRDLCKHNCRLVLLTTDISMLTACSGQPYTDEQEENGFNSFAEAYLRHPLSLLADPGAWPVQLKESNVSYNKLKYLLLPSAGNHLLTEQRLLSSHRNYEPWKEHNEIAERMIGADEKSVAEEFFKDWGNLWQQADKASAVENAMCLEEELKKTWDSALSKQTFASALLALVYEPVTELVESMGTSFDLPLIEQHMQRQSAGRRSSRSPRGLPPISFDVATRVREAYCALISLPSERANDLSDKEIREIIREDDTFYTFCLYIAAALCVYNHLERVFIFARQAVMIGDHLWMESRRHIGKSSAIRIVHSDINGGEAYYFFAYITRLVARKTSDLDRVEQLIKQAEKRYEALQTPSGNGGQKKASFIDPRFRFKSLRLSNDMSRLFFKIYVDKNALNGNEESLKSKLKCLQNNLQKLLVQTEEYQTSPFYEERIVRGDILCNLLVLAIEQYSGDSENDRKDIRKWIDLLEDNLWPEDKPKLKKKEKSQYIQMVLKIAKVLFGAEDIDERQIKECYLMLSDKEMQVFPYDKERYKKYQEYILSKRSQAD